MVRNVTSIEEGIEMSEIRAVPANEVAIEQDSVTGTVEGSAEEIPLIPPPKKNFWKMFTAAITHPAAGSVACCLSFFFGLLVAVVVIMKNVPLEELKPTAYCTLPGIQKFTKFNINVQFVWVSTEKPPPGLFVELNLFGTYDDAVGRIVPSTSNVFFGAVEYPMSNHFDSLKNRRMPWTKEEILMYCDFENDKKLYYTGLDGRIARYEE